MLLKKIKLTEVIFFYLRTIFIITLKNKKKTDYFENVYKSRKK